VAYGLCSIGRDGEAADALDAAPKPRLRLGPGTLFASATALLPRNPALEVLSLEPETSALGPLALVRVRVPSTFEIAGPPSARALRRVAARLREFGGLPVLIDGAVDRIAALRGASDAIVVAVGADSAPTLGHAVDDVRALIARLRLPAVDASREVLHVGGALTAAAASALAAAGEERQVVVRDPTRIVFGGRAFLALAARLDLRCERVLHPIACTVAPLGVARSFEPREFLESVARATELPTYDVFAGAAA